MRSAQFLLVGPRVQVLGDRRVSRPCALHAIQPVLHTGRRRPAGPGVLAGGVRSGREPGMSLLPLSDALIHTPQKLSSRVRRKLKTRQELVHTHVAVSIRCDVALAIMQARANCAHALCHAR